jgi:hypothetical protein
MVTCITYVTQMINIRNACRILVGNLYGQDLLHLGIDKYYRAS